MFPDDLAVPDLVPGFAGGLFPVERARQDSASFTDDGFSIEHVMWSTESGHTIYISTLFFYPNTHLSDIWQA